MKMSVVGKVRILLGTFLVFSALLATTAVQAESQSGSVGLSGKVIASAPSVAPVITLPIDQTHFSDSEIRVSGTCQNDQLIKIFINDNFSGSVTCGSSKFSIAVDISQGKNQIFVRGFDNLDQATPDSNIVEVYLDDSSDTLILTSALARQKVDPGNVLSWPITIKGGNKPFAISIDWGDSRTTLKSLDSPGEFIIEHNYQKAGVYKIVIRAVDQDGDRAILQLVSIVNGKVTASTSDDTGRTNRLFLWQPMAVVIVFMIITFWLGKKYARRSSEVK